MNKLLPILLCVVALRALGATYYVDYADGSNSNAGTSTNAPWKHAPGDVRASGSVASSLSAGDSVLFKSGSTYVLTNTGIQLNWSGATNNRITYGTYGGTGRAWITGDRTLAPHTLNALEAPSMKIGLNFLNLKITDVGGYNLDDPIWATDTQGCTTNLLTAPFGGAGIRFENGFGHVLIDNCEIARIGTWTNASPLSGTQSVSGSGVVLDGGTNAVVSNTSITHARNGIRIQASSSRPIADITVTNCDIGNFVVWNIDVSMTTSSTSSRNLLILDSRIHNKWQHDQTQWTGCGDAPHTDGIFLRNSGTAAIWTNTVINGCEFYSDAPSSSGGTAMIYASEGGGGDLLIANNVFRNAHDSAVIQIAPGSRQPGGRSVYILHNTFGGSTRNIRFTGTNHVIYAEGNVFTRTTASQNNTIINFESTNSYNFRRNLYYNPSIPTATYYPFYRLNWASGWNGYTTFAGWTGLGYDTQSKWGDPLFIDGTNAVMLSRNYQPGAASEARSLAPDLASIYPQWAQWLAYDKNGNPRVEPFDAGAYQYTGDVPPPPPPPSSDGAEISVEVTNLTVNSVVVSP